MEPYETIPYWLTRRLPYIRLLSRVSRPLLNARDLVSRFPLLFWCAWNAAVSSIVYYGIAAYLQNMPWMRVLAYNNSFSRACQFGKNALLTRMSEKKGGKFIVGHRWISHGCVYKANTYLIPVNRTLPPILAFAAHARLWPLTFAHSHMAAYSFTHLALLFEATSCSRDFAIKL